MKKLLQEFYRMKQLAGLNENISLNQEQLNQIMQGYITCAIWTEEESLRDEQGKGFEQEDDDDDDDLEDNDDLNKLIQIQNQLNQQNFISFSEENIAPNSIIQAYNDIKTFLANVNPNYLSIALKEQGAERLGHDIWLTRNHHGAGFFDHNYDSDVEHQLTQAAHNLKETDLYIGDDGLLHFSNA